MARLNPFVTLGGKFTFNEGPSFTLGLGTTTPKNNIFGGEYTIDPRNWGRNFNHGIKLYAGHTGGNNRQLGNVIGDASIQWGSDYRRPAGGFGLSGSLFGEKAFVAGKGQINLGGDNPGGEWKIGAGPSGVKNTGNCVLAPGSFMNYMNLQNAFNR